MCSLDFHPRNNQSTERFKLAVDLRLYSGLLPHQCWPMYALSGGFCGFPHFRQENAGTVP